MSDRENPSKTLRTGDQESSTQLMQTIEQADLDRRLLDNDELVLDEVLRAFGPMVMAVMRRRYHDVLRETDIEDAVSLGLYRLWKSRHLFDKRKASLKVWFCRIVENGLRDVLRHGWHKARLLEVTTDGILTDISTKPSGREQTETGQAADNSLPTYPTALQCDVRDIVAALPETQRRIVMADAAAPDDVADSSALGRELDLPASTIRVYRKRALDRIRRELASRGHDVPGL